MQTVSADLSIVTPFHRSCLINVALTDLATIIRYAGRRALKAPSTPGAFRRLVVAPMRSAVCPERANRRVFSERIELLEPNCSEHLMRGAAPHRPDGAGCDRREPTRARQCVSCRSLGALKSEVVSVYRILLRFT